MGRKNGLVQLTLRLPGELRARIGEQADKNHASVNNEVSRRLRESFEQPAIKTIETIAADLSRTWSRVQKKLEAVE